MEEEEEEEKLVVVVGNHSHHESMTLLLPITTPTTTTTLTATTTTDDTTSKEEQLEDRYNKLRSIALKLKKKIKEQTEEIAQLQKEKSKYQNASKIQLEFDKAQDEVERLRSEKKLLEKDIQKAVEENVSLKVKSSEDSGRLASLTGSHKVLRERVEKLEKEVGELEGFRGKAESLEKELKGAKESEASAEQEKRQSAILSLEITDYERKLQEGSKQLEEKKAEVEALRNDLTLRSQLIDTHERSIQDFKDKELQLTRSKESLQADLQRKLEKITFLQDEMSKLKEKLSEKSLEYIRLEQEYENSKLAFSSQSKELVEKVDGLQRMITTLEHKISVLEENKRSRETHVANLKLELQQLESEYSSYKTKAQTMLLLKSQRPPGGQSEQQQQQQQQSSDDELENLQKIVQNYQSDISILKTDLQTLKLQNDNLLTEKSEFSIRFNQLKTDSLEKDIRMTNELQKLKQDMRQKEDLHRIHVEEVQKANATSLAGLQTRMDDIKEKYESQLHCLQQQLVDNINYYDDDYDLGKQQQDNPSLIPSHHHHHSSAFRPVVTNNNNDGGGGGGVVVVATSSIVQSSSLSSSSEQQPGGGDSDTMMMGLFNNNGGHSIHHHHHQPLAVIDTGNLSFEQLRMIPRGEGEGSESVCSAFTPRASVDNYLSFEQLLSGLDSSGRGIERRRDKSNKHDDDDDDDDDDESINFKEELIRSQNQVSHLTALLRESESNCDRLGQLSDALKEEIRRVEREKERKEHLKENTEYLKNVLLKFMTLHGEEERRRLIPVMKTMLQLTNEEVSRLENSFGGGGGGAGSGGGSHPHHHHPAPTLGGWSSYLPLWGSGTTEK